MSGSDWPMVADWVRRLRIPVRDPRFWVIQMLVLVIDIGHLLLEHTQVLLGESELYLLSVSVFLIPVVYAALAFGLRGAVPTALWALVLSLPEISMHGWTTRIGIVTQFSIVLAIAIIVALRVDKEHEAARASEQANRRLSRLNATASAVASSLELDHVLRATLRAQLDPNRVQVAWVLLLPDGEAPGETYIEASQMDQPRSLDASQRALTEAACITGLEQRSPADRAGVHTAVAALTCEGQTVGALGVTQPVDGIVPDEFHVLGAMAKQLSVALDNIRTHARTSDALIQLSQAKENLEIYIEMATEAQEEERKRLSRELHDDILQSLAVARGQVEAVTASAQPGVDTARLTEVLEILTDTMGNVRRYCKALRPSLLDDLGLVDAVEWLTADMQKRTGLRVELAVDGDRRRLGSRDELLVFRIVQEALNNVESHADATHARARLVFNRSTLTVVVSDDGRGMAPTGRSGGHPSSRGLGLRGMDERTKLLRGVLVIESRTGAGTTITLTMPSTAQSLP